MRARPIRRLQITLAGGVAVLALVFVAVVAPAGASAADPSPSPAVTLPPSVGAPGTTNAGTTIRGAIGVVIGLVVVVIGWRRRRRANPAPARPRPTGPPRKPDSAPPPG